MQTVEPGGELRFEHSILHPTKTLCLTVYFQISDDGQKARWVEARPTVHPNGILMGADVDRRILAANALGFRVGDKLWLFLDEVIAPLEEKGIPFWYVPASDEEVAIRREIFEIQEIRKTNSRNEKINQRGKELVERLPALMEGRASAYGIIEWFEHIGDGGGWLFKPTGYHGAYMGIHGSDRFAVDDDSFPNDAEAFAALEQYVKNPDKTKRRNKTPIFPFMGQVALESLDEPVIAQTA